jgi:diacylglycerol kinase (ATP)
MHYSKATIIFNPNSTGPSAAYAKDLKSNLQKKYPKLNIDLHPTKYAGHAEKLAYDAAMSSKRPLVISSSGDGGYNEVINGIMKAQNKGAKPTCAVLPAGNANDHSRTLQAKPLLKAIQNESEKNIDLLKININNGSHVNFRYAHLLKLSMIIKSLN